MLVSNHKMEEPSIPTGSSLAGAGTAGVVVLHILHYSVILDIPTYLLYLITWR